MISLYSGTPGSGKSLHMAKRILEYLDYNTFVITNFELILKKDKHIKNHLYIPNSEIVPDRLINLAIEHAKRNKSGRIKEGSIILVLDECQLLFNAREWNIKGRDAWLSFFTQHRKLGYDVILVAQFDKMIDKQIRSLIEYENIHRKVSNFGMFGKFYSLLFGGGLFVSVNMWYPLRIRVSSSFFKCLKKYYGLYDTYATFEKADATHVVTDVSDGVLLDNSNT